MNCKHCGEHFAPYRYTQRFCSPQCRKITYRPKQREWDENNPRRYLLRSAKSRSKTKSIEFNISLDDIVMPEVCPILKVVMIKGTRTAPSLDRIDNSKGYVKGNVLVISTLANTMKNNASVDELKRFAEWVKTL